MYTKPQKRVQNLFTIKTSRRKNIQVINLPEPITSIISGMLKVD